MGIIALLAFVAFQATQDPGVGPASPRDAQESAAALPPPIGSPHQSDRVPEMLPEPTKLSTPLSLPPEEPRRSSRVLEERPEAGPSVGGFVVGSFAVVGLLGGAYLLLRRFGKNSRFLGGGSAIQVLARKPLGPKQEIFLVEVGSKVFMIGSTRDRLTTLGEFAGPDEVAVLRSKLPARRDESLRVEFNESLREGIREEEGLPSGVSPKEGPREERVYASIADELAEIRKTVRAWRA
jgi:flagellar biosynthetic protein FliO